MRGEAHLGPADVPNGTLLLKRASEKECAVCRAAPMSYPPLRSEITALDGANLPVYGPTGDLRVSGRHRESRARRQSLRRRRTLWVQLLCLRRAIGAGTNESRGPQPPWAIAGLRLGWLLRALQQTIEQLKKMRGGVGRTFARGPRYQRSFRAAVTGAEALACAGSLGLVAKADAHPALGGAVGNEFRVNADTTNNQANPAVARNAEGDFVVAWESNGQDGSGNGIYARRYTGRSDLPKRRIPGQLLHDRQPVPAGRGDGCRRRLCRHLDEHGTGWQLRRSLRAALQCYRNTPRRGVPC